MTGVSARTKVTPIWHASHMAKDTSNFEVESPDNNRPAVMAAGEGAGAANPERGADIAPHDGRGLLQRPGAVYLDAILREAPRVLGLMDREEYSPTRGCIDRTHWAWKFTDFPGARFQEGLCVLSFLYATDVGAGSYYHNPRLLNWIASGFDFWSAVQRPRGDFDEAYPYERSLAATAFTAFYVSEAYHFLRGRLPADTAERFRESLARAGDWLIANDERHGFLSNHLAAAAGALCHAHGVCGDARYAERCRYFLQKILDHQSHEGWYEEYGGADPGYQTHGSFYLARCLQMAPDERLADSLERSFAFLAHFVHADGSLGGEYASRNTQTYYPAAFEIMAQRSGRSSWIAETMRPSVESLAAAGLGSVDAYNYFSLLNNNVFAYVACAERTGPAAPPIAPPSEPGITNFPAAGIVKIRRPTYEAFVGLSKGGVLKAFDRQSRRLMCDDCGYLGRMKSGGVISSQWFDDTRKVDVDYGRVTVSGRFYEIKKPTMKPWPFIGFRLFTLTIGRMQAVGYWLKRLLVRVLVYRRRALDFSFKRSITFTDDGFELRDELRSPLAHKIDKIERVDSFATIHMGSSRYFVPHQLVAGPDALPVYRSVDLAGLGSGVVLERKVLAIASRGPTERA